MNIPLLAAVCALGVGSACAAFTPVFTFSFSGKSATAITTGVTSSLAGATVPSDGVYLTDGAGDKLAYVMTNTLGADGTIFTPQVAFAADYTGSFLLDIKVTTTDTSTKYAINKVVYNMQLMNADGSAYTGADTYDLKLDQTLDTGAATNFYSLSVAQPEFAMTSATRSVGFTPVASEGYDLSALTGDARIWATLSSNLATESTLTPVYLAVTSIQLGYEDVPEPATATLSLLGLAGLCLRRRR